MDTVWICHPKLPGQETQVPESAVAVLAHSGWLLMDGPPEQAPAPEVGRADVYGRPHETTGEQADDSSKPPAKNKTRGTRASESDTEKGQGDH